jgi:aryl-alcohol dehydrogenase-like predicted oxidoreductase
MEQRTLGRSGVVLPVIGFGCGPNAQLMVGSDVELQQKTVAHALEIGVNFFDTAALYGDGRSELNLGRALHELGATPIVCTKVLLDTSDYADVRGGVLRSVESSLDRLQLTSVSSVMLHNRVGSTRDVRTEGAGVTVGLDDVFGPRGLIVAFDELRRAGITTTAGFTCFGGEPRAILELIDSGSFDALNASYNVVNPSALRPVGPNIGEADYEQVIAAAAARGMGVMAIRVLSSGALLGPVADGKEARLGAIAEEAGESVVGLAIRYVLSTSDVTTAIMGISEPRHLDDAVDAASRGPLDTATVTRIEAIALE